MDELDFLEQMAQAAMQMDCLDSSDTPPGETIHRWQTMFGYSRAEAVQQIEDKRRDLGGRITLTTQLWEAISADKEAQCYDKESYEHACWLSSRRSATTTTAAKNSHIQHCQEALGAYQYSRAPMGGRLLHVQVPKALHLDRWLVRKAGLGDGVITAKTIQAIKQHSAELTVSVVTRFLPISTEKSLSAFSIHPTLGIESTLPQYRIDSLHNSRGLLPKQGQYPVWYFFYGTLAQPDVLNQLLGLEQVLTESLFAIDASLSWVEFEPGFL
ncbi:hypothetical protein QBC38DRAFT_499409 [Podospora fimiseda]|uniref:Gamma-glutamylcyclotransferase AIG2-like domain-containing protein n=1 Tax=Podospora fimiseda TaxID=252190 RepID=A0AAN7BQ40_9PEZI|nr:hypothetical protein QBC38DRAFT_499409 [Podospora fimiseda]